MNKSRVLSLIAALAVALVLYAALGFFLVPVLIKQQLIAHVEHQLKHKLTLGEVRFNPFTFALEAQDFNLQEASGGDLVSFKRLYVNFEAISVFQRAWDFTEVTLEAPLVYGELRPDGSNNFTALLAALSDPRAKPDIPPPPLKVAWIRVTEGRIDLADLQAGKSARLRIEPIALELTAMSTLEGEKGPYKLTARTGDREILTWDGDLSLYPIASTGKLIFSDWKLATVARMLGSRISIEEPAGKIDASLEYVAGYVAGKPSLDVKDLDLRLSQFTIVPKGSAVALAAAEQLALSNITFALNERAVSIQRTGLLKGRLALEIDADGRQNWTALFPGHRDQKEAQSAPDAPRKEAPAMIDKTAAAPSWRVNLRELASTDLALKFADRRTHAELEIQRTAVTFALAAELGAGGSTLAIDGLKATADAIAIDIAGERVVANQLELAAPVVKASFNGAGDADLSVEAPAASVSGLALRQAASVLDAQRLALRAGSLSATRPQASSTVRMEIADAAIESTAIAARALSAKKDALELRAFDLGAKSVAIALGDDGTDAILDALIGNISGVTAREPAQDTEILRLERARLTGGALNLRERRINFERLALEDGHAGAAIDATGKLDWAAFIAALGGSVQQLSNTQDKAAPAWQAMVKEIELQNLAGAFLDQRQTPPLAVSVSNVNARASNVGTDPATPSRINLTGRIKGGGTFSANGSVNPHTLEADLKVKLVDFSVPPMRPIIVRQAGLRLASALVSADGRLRYGLRKSAGADLVFEGDVDVKRVSIDETEPQQPFLTVDAVRASEVTFAISPNRLDIPELRVDGFNSKLVIAEDQSATYLGKLLRWPAEKATQPGSPPAAKQPAETSNDELPISIARIRIDRSQLDFGDLSLRPQFAVRMHDLKGVVTGVSTAPGSIAQLELEGRVDEFGSARIQGEINAFNARAFTAIDMEFRNIEMTTLTPYTTKFAGYRIASGKLSTDLQYRIKDSVLVGENRLVLDKLELGERVDSPTAINIPLDLAIAILKDSDGRIDIGVPVHGSLDDPEFSYGHVIWKAIGDVFSRIITAPFRALASLFGGGSDKLETIEFDPGRDTLMPPERQKLRTVAEALSKRPQLKLIVKPAYAEKLDRAALQSDAVRREIATRSGIKLAPGEDPGPVDYANPRTQRAIETLFVDRNSSAAARDLRAQQKTSAAQSAGSAKPAASTDADIARVMTQQLLGAQPVPDNELTALAKRRGDVITAELKEAGKIDPARLDTAQPNAVDAGSDRSVTTALELAVAK